jgi:hypothetical protein
MLSLTPKQKPSRSAHWFGYYAGYSPAFVAEVLKQLAVRTIARECAVSAKDELRVPFFWRRPRSPSWKEAGHGSR